MSFAPLVAKDRRGEGSYMQSHSREATGTSRLINMQSRGREAFTAACYPILLNMYSHSREATVMPRRRGVAVSYGINPNIHWRG